MKTSWQVQRVLQGPSLSQLFCLPRSYLLAWSVLQTMWEGKCWKEKVDERDVFLTLFQKQLHKSPHFKVFHMRIFNISLSLQAVWHELLDGAAVFSTAHSHPTQMPEKVKKTQWKMQKMTVRSIDVFQSCNLLTYFHQAQWHRLYIRIREHQQKKEKHSLKKDNSHGEFKATKYYLPQFSQIFL